MEQTETPAAVSRDRALRKVRVGEVVSDKMDKTIVVRTITRVPHPKFGKITKHVAKFHAHDEKNEAKLGDRVSIMETRPLSRTKRWRLLEVLKH
ncbi:MAG: 30S ribosomal protein S17 [Verrucomicrobia bacterium]|jgi:small subunit ribosomal protein S17|nr:30S ribosomal protein S17 [Verrucomicrobiota bacterium]